MPNVSLKTLCSFRFSGPDSERFRALQTIVSTLTHYQGKLRGSRAKVILLDILSDCGLKLLEERSLRACWRRFNNLSGEDLEEVAKDVADAGKKYIALYVQHRRKCDAEKFRAMIDGWTAALREISKKTVSQEGILKVLFVLPDGYGVENIRILMNGREVASGVFKNRVNDTIFEKYFFIPADTAVKEISFTAQGFAGQGIAYVSARTNKGRFLPEGITGCAGIVEHPEHLLTPDINFAYLGSQNIHAAFRDRARAVMINTVSVKMKRETP